MSGIGKDYRVPPGIGQYDAFWGQASDNP